MSWWNALQNFINGPNSAYNSNVKDAEQNFAYQQLPAYGMQPQQQPQAQPQPQATQYSGGGRAVAAPAYDPNTDPNAVAQARGQVQPMIGQLNGLYDQIYNGINSYAQDQRGQLDNQFQTSQQDDAKQYSNAVDQTNGAFTGRNAFDSSYRGNAQQMNTDAYNKDLNQLNLSHDQGLQNIGHVVATQKAGLGDRPQFDLSQYNDVNSLTQLREALDQHITGLKGTQANLLTGGQLKAQLDQAAPVSGISSQLKGQLDKLVASSAAPEAKMGLANGYINLSGLPQDEKNKWLTYVTGALGSKPQTAAV
jgi:hypothetical protein